MIKCPTHVWCFYVYYMYFTCLIHVYTLHMYLYPTHVFIRAFIHVYLYMCIYTCVFIHYTCIYTRVFIHMYDICRIYICRIYTCIIHMFLYMCRIYTPITCVKIHAYYKYSTHVFVIHLTLHMYYMCNTPNTTHVLHV